VKDNKFYEIKRIGQNAFNGCSEINGAIKFPSTLVMVEDEAFSGCPNIIDIANAYGQIGTSNLYVEKIGGVKVLIDTPTFDEISRVQGSCAFGANLNLSDVPNLTGISTFAFNRCDNMTGTLTLPSTLINVGDAAFYGCNNISIIIGKCTAEPTWLGRDIFSN
jgi:hypothetical protein